MATYVRKPGRIEAVQWQAGRRFNETPEWLTDALARPHSQCGAMYRDEDEVMVMTPDGELPCKVGDYVVRRGNGDLHVLAAQTFQQTYERAKKET